MRLIDADEAVKIIKRYDDRGLTLDEVTRVTDGIAKEIEAMPTVDAVEVRHGKWIPIIDDYINCSLLSGYKCSLCGRHEEKEEPYCHCGAKMDGG